MKKVVIFGAAGQTGKYIVLKLLDQEDVTLRAFVRDASKLEGLGRAKLDVAIGDALDREDVSKALDDRDILLCSLEGDVFTMARNIIEALPKTPVRRTV